MKDEILREVWQSRDEFAKRHNYDIEAMVATLRKMERHPWSTVTDRSKKTPKKQLRSGAASRPR
jgi:hypothetical protein